MTLTEVQPAVAPPARRSRARRFAPYLAMAVLLVIPCVWNQHIQANDLSSHLYNAWLANRAQAGELPGLYVVRQYTNVFFDLMLSGLLRTGSVVLTERVAVATAVQLFFWGCFALVSAVGRRPAWSMTPFLVLLAYGVIFRIGFFNFYISVGICCAAIALVWWNRPRVRWLAIPLLLAAVTAHFLPCLWAIAVIAYVALARRVKALHRLWLLGGALISLAAVALFIARDIPSRWMSGLRVESFFGADQALTFGGKYKIVAAALLCCWILLLARRFEAPVKPWRDIAFQVWFLVACACLLLPDAIHVQLYTGGLTFTTIRLSLLSGILLCAVSADVPVRLPERIVHLAVLAVYLLFSHGDERSLDRFEQKIARAVASLPLGSRVVSRMKEPQSYIQALQHAVDRPCIGRCFDFVNYEPSTGQFRLRGRADNPYMVVDYDQIGKIEDDKFTLPQTDFNIFQLVPCLAGNDVCTSAVRPGEQFRTQEIHVLTGVPWALGGGDETAHSNGQ